MRAQIIFGIASTIALAFSGCSARDGNGSAAVPLISFHFGAQKGATNVFAFDGGNFDSKAILSDPDFVDFDSREETWTLKPKAALRLSDAIWNRFSELPRSAYGRTASELLPFPTWFVLKAEGQPIFKGVFYPLGSSITYRQPMFIATPAFMTTNEMKNVVFSRGIQGFESSISEQRKPNMPGDPRIAAAAAKLTKMK